MEELNNLLFDIRKRLSEYRYEQRNAIDSVHVNALEIALCLTEYLIRKNRAIHETEKSWFDAGWYIIQLFEGTDFTDLAEKYSRLCKVLKEYNFKLE